MTDGFDGLIKQITSYNLFNYLLPGATFCALMEIMFAYPLVLDNLFAAFFFYYFIGLIISRFGSIIIEPFLKLAKWIHFRPYPHFVAASKLDPKIDQLSESNNVYRTLISLPICAAMYHLGVTSSHALGLSDSDRAIVFFAALFILFAISYRKQTAYVCKRIDANLSPTASNRPDQAK